MPLKVKPVGVVGAVTAAAAVVNENVRVPLKLLPAKSFTVAGTVIVYAVLLAKAVVWVRVKVLLSDDQLAELQVTLGLEVMVEVVTVLVLMASLNVIKTLRVTAIPVEPVVGEVLSIVGAVASTVTTREFRTVE